MIAEFFIQITGQTTQDSLLKIVRELQKNIPQPNSIGHDLLVGVLGSILSSGLITIIVLFSSRRFKRAFTHIFGLYTKSDVVYVYKDKADAKPYIDDAIKKASKVFIITSRGNEFQENFHDLWQHLEHLGSEFKVIMPDPDKKDGETDFIDQRQNEMTSLDRAMASLRASIRTNITYLKVKNVNLRLAKTPHFVKIIITDKYLFLEPYNKHWLGHQDNIMQYRRGNTYNCFFRYFDLVWNSLEPLPADAVSS